MCSDAWLYCKITFGDFSSVQTTHCKDTMHCSAVLTKMLFAKIIVNIEECEWQSFDLLGWIRHKYWVTSNGTGTWNFTLMFGCVLHFKFSIYNRSPFSWMLILQNSWYFCSWGMVPKCGSPPERPPIASLHHLICYFLSPFLQLHQLLQL